LWKNITIHTLFIDFKVAFDTKTRNEIYLKLQTTGTIFSKQIQLLAYADDIDIVGRNLKVIHDAYLALEAEAVKEGLKKINEKKTKYMIAAGNRTILDAG
jgi:hypothetical protein